MRFFLRVCFNYPLLFNDRTVIHMDNSPGGSRRRRNTRPSVEVQPDIISKGNDRPGDA